MERLLVRARDPGGVITIYEDPGEAASANEHSFGESSSSAPENPVIVETHEAAKLNVGPAALGVALGEPDWDALLAASGELIAAVERAAQSVSEDFAAHFHSVLIAMGDDYPFLDPTAGVFQYDDGKVKLDERPAAGDFISSLTESLSRIVSKLAGGKAGARFRERVAVELVVVARRKENAFAEFTPHLDRIAGTRVL